MGFLESLGPKSGQEGNRGTEAVLCDRFASVHTLQFLTLLQQTKEVVQKEAGRGKDPVEICNRNLRSSGSQWKTLLA